MAVATSVLAAGMAQVGAPETGEDASRPAAQKRAEQVEASTAPGSFVLSLEQDSVIPPSSDKDYTMGVILEFRGGWVNRSFLARGMSWLDWPGRHLHRGQAAFKERFDFQFGNSAFAPLKENLARTDPVYDDRPYASLLFVAVRRTSTGPGPVSPTRAVVTEWALGVLGLNISREVQTTIHEWVDDILPGGWSNQISNGGEPTVRYRLAERWLVPKLSTEPGFGADASVGVEGNLGFYTNVSAGGRARIGWRHSSWWDYERTSLAPYLLPSAAIGRDGSRPFELFAFASGGGTLWAYNELLQGGFRESAVTLGYGKDPAPLKHQVADWQWGATLSFWKISLTYVESRHTALFGGPNERQHRWRTLSIGF